MMPELPTSISKRSKPTFESKLKLELLVILCTTRHIHPQGYVKKCDFSSWHITLVTQTSCVIFSNPNSCLMSGMCFGIDKYYILLQIMANWPTSSDFPRFFCDGLVA